MKDNLITWKRLGTQLDFDLNSNPGVYIFVINRTKFLPQILYVGETKNLSKRIAKHLVGLICGLETVYTPLFGDDLTDLIVEIDLYSELLTLKCSNEKKRVS